MNHEQLQSLLTQAEEELNKGNYDQAEKLANEVLAHLDSFPSSAAKEDSAEGGDGVESEQHRTQTTIRAEATRILGTVSWRRSEYLEALDYYNRALAAHVELGEKSGVANVMGNIGVVYYSLGKYPQALDYYRRALTMYEELGEKSGVASVMGNIGIVYYSLGKYSEALQYYSRALVVHEELGNKSSAALVTSSIGNVYKKLGEYSQVLEYYSRGLAAHEELGEKYGIAGVMASIGSLFADEKFAGFDAEKAEQHLLQALSMLEEIDAKQDQFEYHKSLAEIYEKQGRWQESHFHFKKYHELEKEVQSEEAKKQAELLDYERKQSEREKHIAVERAKHEATEQLLHNVLPPSIAHRMVAGEKLIAEKLPSVSVLFADIVGFTKLSQRITAEELVEGLDTIFSSFDILVEKHGLEKIKTIGDAYMVVAGAPEARTDHAEAMANFALDMLEAMKEFHSISTGEEIQLRIGIHSGEVVAGVIGKKKFAYDLWGDAVNTASRMESHGEPGKIHISDDFRTAVETCRGTTPLSIEFIERGEMDIKGKGMMNTYFLERA